MGRYRVHRLPPFDAYRSSAARRVTLGHTRTTDHERFETPARPQLPDDAGTFQHSRPRARRDAPPRRRPRRLHLHGRHGVLFRRHREGVQDRQPGLLLRLQRPRRVGSRPGKPRPRRRSGSRPDHRPVLPGLGRARERPRRRGRGAGRRLAERIRSRPHRGSASLGPGPSHQGGARGADRHRDLGDERHRGGAPRPGRLRAPRPADGRRRRIARHRRLPHGRTGAWTWRWPGRRRGL